MSSWQKAGFSFNKYLSIAARTVRKSLNSDIRVAAEKRGITDLKAQVIEKGDIKSTVELGSR
ncbi:F1F0 ATP synthase subunit epsilon, mitochondrial [Komagataella phaffii CBS 7435]|uniref:Uncharacterized protein n=2 Tax=Komagataella phaffii TaxID=460519 RepID=C4R177_KOMPG|nr:Hypothetical protein PAS_chr2-1_0612 [Komagataella phaffii GS115]CAH2448222.1 Hypothetical protein BQ9382_C2-3651 [Komagataella phaffii CBS 7435]CAY69251.1 Hypothetical protein PAS_chr2-1_0612 [Komagataella phaffii GS115]SCV12049.1 F1F0 ATP synthase subunit epsilon, mitochondrial [Komagataella phaffii CBS 7435]